MATSTLTESARFALRSLVIAMDGPAGSGKSSASRGVAQSLGLRYLDTGAMYRAMTWRMLLDRVDVTDPAAVAARADDVLIEAGTDSSAPTITLDGDVVSRQIRTDGVTAAVSSVSAVPQVRRLLVAQQRTIIGSGGIVVEGRDIGTVVAPNAAVKVYLSADPMARAQRRSAEMATGAVGTVAAAAPGVSVQAVQADLLRRDAFDSSRVTSPLSRASDAVVLDTTHLSLDDVISAVVDLAVDHVGRLGVARDG